MRMFSIISRKGLSSIQEVEIQFVSSLEDPSVLWMGKGEYKAKVLKPESLFEKQKDGSLTPPVWCWHAFYQTEEAARAQAESDLKHEMERAAGKGGAPFDVITCLARCKEIQTFNL